MKWILALFSLTNLANADGVLPIPEETHSRLLPDDKTISGEYEYRKRYTSEAEKNAQLQSEVDKARQALTQTYKANPDALLAPIQNKKSAKKVIASPVLRSTPTQTTNVIQAPIQTNYVQTFTVTSAGGEKSTLPLGSYVKARVLSGVEVSQDPFPMLLQLDYAFTGPNKTKIDLSNCLMIAKAKANLSTERVIGEATEISCVREDGEHIKRSVKGFIAGEDSTFGMAGQLISKQGQVFLAAVLANLAKGAGEAVGAAQTTSQAVSTATGGVDKVTNVTGNKAAFVAGKASADAATLISQWYLDYARQIVPSIAVGSGRSIWVVMLDSVEIPQLTQNNIGE